jgi:hypothetical protein
LALPAVSAQAAHAQALAEAALSAALSHPHLLQTLDCVLQPLAVPGSTATGAWRVCMVQVRRPCHAAWEGPLLRVTRI